MSTLPGPVPGENPALDAETRVPILVGTSIAFALAACIVVLLRLWTRYAVVKATGPDDITITVAVVLSVGVSAVTIIQAENGLGRHVWMVTPDMITTQLRSLFAAEVVYNLAQIMTKLSFLLQYRRIFQDAFTRRVSLGMMVFLAIWGVAQEFLLAFACTPIADLYPDRQGRCLQTDVIWHLTSVMNIVTDFLVFLIPIPAVKHLQLRRKQKFLVGGIFCLGFFTCLISIIRLFTIRAALHTDDPTWDNVPTSYWSVIEVNCGILCASAATLRPLLRRILPGLGTRDDAKYNYRYGASGSHHSKTEVPEMYALPNLDAEMDADGPARGDGGDAKPVPCEHHHHHHGGKGEGKNSSQDGLIWPMQGRCETCGYAPAAVGPRTDITAGRAGPGRKASVTSVRQDAAPGGEIMVTRETTFQESRKGKPGPARRPDKEKVVLGIGS